MPRRLEAAVSARAPAIRLSPRRRKPSDQTGTRVPRSSFTPSPPSRHADWSPRAAALREKEKTARAREDFGDLFHGIPRQLYTEGRDVSLWIRKEFPPETHHYVLVGRSPALIACFLESLDHGSVTHLPFSGAHMPGQTVRRKLTEVYPPLSQDQESRLFAHLDRCLPEPEALRGKKLLFIDFASEGKGMSSLLTYLSRYKRASGKKLPMAALALTEAESIKVDTKRYPHVVKEYQGDSNIPVRLESLDRSPNLLMALKDIRLKKFASYGQFKPGDDRPQAREPRLAYQLLKGHVEGRMRGDDSLAEAVSPAQLAQLRSAADRRGELVENIELLREVPQFMGHMAAVLDRYPRRPQLLAETLARDPGAFETVRIIAEEAIPRLGRRQAVEAAKAVLDAHGISNLTEVLKELGELDLARYAARRLDFHFSEFIAEVLPAFSERPSDLCQLALTTWRRAVEFCFPVHADRLKQVRAELREVALPLLGNQVGAKKLEKALESPRLDT